MSRRELKGRYTSYESIFHRLLDERIEQAVTKRSLDLGAGSARKEGAADTAAAYYEEVGAIRGLRDVQRICEEIADELIRGG